MKTIFDPHLLQREYHNQNSFQVRFTRMRQYDAYVVRAGKYLGPAIVTVEPDCFVYLPHGYYLIEGVGVPKGEPLKMLMNLEKAMFRGNKIPSNPYGQNG